MGIDLNDWVWHYPSNRGPRFKIYRHTCALCGKDTGYRIKANPSGNKCSDCVGLARVKRTLTPEQLLRVNLLDVKRNSCGSKRYRMRCVQCGDDRGHQLIRAIDLPCPKCAAKNRRIRNITKDLHSNVDYNDYTVAENGLYFYRMTCVECGSDRGYQPLYYWATRCLRCAPSSHGEGKIAQTLDALAVSYTREARVDALILSNPLRFDFYIPSNGIYIE